jgi:NAD(P)-dependent dehydrogenase (short-subunit alcohol dehydrogenase family)
MDSEKARAVLAQSSPQNRLIEPDEIASLAVYLSSDAARGINGQAINIDGGSLMY